jgi:L-alanine-DL-glutamate epimerase-like enolase superfamily enzyme
MTESPIIKKIQLTMYRIPMNNLTSDLAFSAGMFYKPGSVYYRSILGIHIHTDVGITGEHTSGTPGIVEQIQMFAPFLVGRNALERELFYNQAKMILRKNDRMGIGPIDIALWDLAGKYHNAPVYRLLGGYREKLPTYASTYHADREPDGLSSPQGYADFAEQCLEMGYPGFKIHSWGAAPIELEIETVHAVGKRVGGKMALMLDPCCVYDTYGDALQVGLACDEEGYYWYEDPLKDGGVSFTAHRRLREALKTPLLQGEHLHLVEAHMDMANADATDFWRADPEYDGGITGVMKIAHAAEGVGMDVELHGAGAAQRHCMAAIRNSNFYEMTLVHPKVHTARCVPTLNGYADRLDSIDENGCVSVPQEPGLGVQWDWAAIEKYRVDEVIIE